jgi:hypothetical protein
MGQTEEDTQAIWRIRGTFIDLRPCQAPRKTRSRSAPPGRTDPAPNVSNDAHSYYISSLAERAMCLLQKSPDSNSEKQLESSGQRIQQQKTAQAKWDSAKYKRINLCRTGRTDAAVKWLEENCSNPKTPHEEGPFTTEITTLMICDIPCRRTIEQLVGAIDGVGFANTYNLVYMPSKRPMYSQNVNMGYAFVNFKTVEFAAAFSETFQNFNFPGSLSKKMSYAKAARYQGYQVNLDRYLKQYVVGCLLVFDEKSQVEVCVT